MRLMQKSALSKALQPPRSTKKHKQWCISSDKASRVNRRSRLLANDLTALYDHIARHKRLNPILGTCLLSAFLLLSRGPQSAPIVRAHPTDPEHLVAALVVKRKSLLSSGRQADKAVPYFVARPARTEYRWLMAYGTVGVKG